MAAEVLNIGKKEVPIFRKAIENTSKRTFIANTSIEVKDDGRIIVEDTRAHFLITLGQEYQKLLDK